MPALLSASREELHKIAARVSADNFYGCTKSEVLHWLLTCETPYRIRKPNIPFRHLCVYALLSHERRFLLMNHAKAGMWLPVGGHLEDGEFPGEACEREILEEICISLVVPSAPFFVTCTTVTDGSISHEDVTFWYLKEVGVEHAREIRSASGEELRWQEMTSLRDSPSKVGLDIAVKAAEAFLPQLGENCFHV